MKNLIILFGLLLFVSLTSCEKEDVVTPEDPSDPNAITTEMLHGDWNFVSLDYKDRTFTDCNEGLKREYLLTTLNFKDVTDESMTLYTTCTSDDSLWERNWEYEINGTELKFENGTIFEILSTPEEIKNGTLKFEFIYSKGEWIPIGGIYTLQQ